MNKQIGRVFVFKEFGAVIGFSIVFIAFALYIPRSFLSLQNLGSMVTMAAQLGIMAVGISFLMISGEFDLSVGSVYAFCPMILAIAVENGIPPVVAFFIGLIFAGFVGVSNGLITLKLGIPSFITTLGMMMFIRGIILAITGGIPITYKPQSAFDLIPALNLRFGSTNFRASAIWFIFLVIIFTYILDRTRYGNWVSGDRGRPADRGGFGSELAKDQVDQFHHLLRPGWFFGHCEHGAILNDRG